MSTGVFWTNSTSEAKRNYRFKVTMMPFGAENSVVWWAKTVTLPAFDVSEVEHNHMDNKFYFPGRVSWTEVSMTLVDPITPDATDLLNKMLIDSGYIIPATADKASTKSTISKAKAHAGGLGLVQIDVLNAEGTAVESWELKNAFIKAAKFGDLDYSNDELKQVDLTLRYDWAVCTAGGNVSFAALS